MLDQGAVLDGRDFGLIETLLWTREDGYFLLEGHLSRLAASARTLGFAFDEARVVRALRQAATTQDAARLRVRLVMQADGAIETSATPIEPLAPGARWKVVPATTRFRSVDPLLRHKTTRRALYEDELAAAARLGADEALFLNERDEVCEGARCNVFLETPDGLLATPPLDCGLLPGVLRGALIEKGRAVERVLRLSDFEGASFYMGNSVRGLAMARLVL